MTHTATPNRPTHRPMLALIAALVLASTACAAPPDAEDAPAPSASRADALVFGDDSRRDLHDVQEPMWRDLMRTSTVAITGSGFLFGPDGFDALVNAYTLGDTIDLCQDQAFLHQPRMAYCSGVLVDDDLVLTARHCLRDAAECEDARLVFDFNATSATDTVPVVAAHNRYRCRQLIAPAYHDQLDMVFVQLDRPVSGGPQPIDAIWPAGALDAGTQVRTIGTPNGLPFKLSEGEVIYGRDGVEDFFSSTLDAFSGNSGGPTFTEDGALAGVLVRSNRPDYVPRGDCLVPRTVDLGKGVDSREQAEAVYAYRAIEALCASGWDSPRLCGSASRGVCMTCASDRECLDGWACTPQGDVSVCTPPCGGDADCRADHACQAGHCIPETYADCDGDTPVTTNVCDHVVARTAQPCGSGAECIHGVCAPSGEGRSCAQARPLEPVDQTLRGRLTHNHSDVASLACGGTGGEHIFQVTLDAPTAIYARMTGLDAVLYARRTCDDPTTEVVCSDNNNVPGDTAFYTSHSAYFGSVLAPGTWYLIADTIGEGGDYTLDLSFTPQCAECQPGETRCDGYIAQECVQTATCAVWSTVESCPCGALCDAGACVAPQRGDTCEDALPIAPQDQTIEVDTTLHRDRLLGSCGGNRGPETVYQFTLDTTTTLTAIATATEGGTDPVLYLSRACVDGSIAQEERCADDVAEDDLSAHLRAELEPGTWLLVADAYTYQGTGYTLDLSFGEPCQDVCAAGALQCNADGDAEVCATDDFGCLSWRVVQTCEHGCDSGVCAPGACQDACDAPGSTQCSGDGAQVEVCVEGGEGCLVWVTQETCADACSAGACADPNATDDETPPSGFVGSDSGNASDDDGCSVAAATPGAAPGRGGLALLALIGLCAIARATRRRTGA